MAVDTPARIAILGAGPIGLEAALYARFLGYEVDLYERGRVCEHWERWAHVRLLTPAGMNRSPLGLAALNAQETGKDAAPDEALLTAREMLDTYFLPLAESDLIVDHLHLQIEVVAVGREHRLKAEMPGDERRAADPFRILLRDREGRERTATADIVIDASGVQGQPNWLGAGGMPAIGEAAVCSQLEHGLPDLLGAAQSDYADRQVLVVGAGCSAATNVLALVELAKQHPATRVTWVTRGEADAPIRLLPNDPLPERVRLLQSANAAAQAGGVVTHLAGTGIHAVKSVNNGAQFEVELIGGKHPPVVVDKIVANVGYRPDHGLSQELQAATSYATEGLKKLTAKLRKQAKAGEPPATGGPEALLLPEPNFYILGAKSFGRSSQFLLTHGHEQIRDLFTIIGDRENLDLYASIQHRRK